jgi:hypothetical protein
LPGTFFLLLLNREHPVTLITETIYQKTLIPRVRILLFPFRFVSFELFYILLRGLELRDFRYIFSLIFFAGFSSGTGFACLTLVHLTFNLTGGNRRPPLDFIPPGIGIVFEFQQEAKTGKVGMILADKLQVCSPAGINAFQVPGKITGQKLTAEFKKSGAVEIFIDPLEYGFRELRNIQVPVTGKKSRYIRVILVPGKVFLIKRKPSEFLKKKMVD